VLELRKRGLSIRAIGRAVGLNRRTVAKYLNAEAFPEMAPRKRRPSLLDPYLQHMRSRWEGGCWNGYQLLREIRELGYKGSRSIVSDQVTRWRRESRSSVGGQDSGSGGVAPTQRSQSVSPRQVHYLLLRQPDKLKREELEFLERLLEASPEARTPHAYSHRFLEIVRERRSGELETWLEEAQQSGIVELRGFVQGASARHSSRESGP
jgi:transposase